MFKHSTGWDLNARMLRLFNDYAEHCKLRAIQSNQDPDWLPNVVREIASDRTLVWC